MARRAPKGGTVLIDEDIGFDLDRLFDHHNMDHIPRERRLDKFWHRNLPIIKHYKAAVKIFGGPRSRKRIIRAPPMETPFKRKLGLYMNQPEYPAAPILNSALNPNNEPLKVLSSSEILDQEEKEKEMKYKAWFAERQALRGNLDSMGLNEAFLQRKGDKSELEKRVQCRMKAARLYKPESPPPPTPVPEVKEPPVVPNVKVPVPSALQILDQFLTEKKMRLVDLFRDADKNRDWKLTKEELQQVVKKHNIPMSDMDIDDLMVTLDKNFDEHLDFKEVSQGLATLKAERRANRREGQSTPSNDFSRSSTLAKISPYSRDQLNSRDQPSRDQLNSRDKLSSNKSRDQMNTNQNHPGSSGSYTGGHSGKESTVQFTADEVGEVEVQPSNTQAGSRTGSASRSRPTSGRMSGSSTPNSLEPPPPDLRQEQRQAASLEEMLELRKHDKAVLERAKAKKWPDKKGPRDEVPGVIRIGHQQVDQHCLQSTLVGDVGADMDQFRRNCLKEYFEVMRVCQEKGIILTPDLLDRVLLYPAETPHAECIKKVALPTGPLAGIPENFAKPPKKPKTPPEIRHKDKMKRSKNGTLMIDVRHMYPPWVKVAPTSSKENLSTGRAMVTRKLDSWMSFEEYDNYTQHLPRRYKKLNIKTSKGGLDPAKSMAHTRSVVDSTKAASVPHSTSHSGNAASVRLSIKSAELPQSSVASETSRGSYATGTKGGKKPKRYKLDEEKFWPGYMLHKLVLYEPTPGDLKSGWGDGQNACFHYTGQKKRGNIGKVKVTGPPFTLEGGIAKYGIDERREIRTAKPLAWN